MLQRTIPPTATPATQKVTALRIISIEAKNNIDPTQDITNTVSVTETNGVRPCRRNVKRAFLSADCHFLRPNPSIARDIHWTASKCGLDWALLKWKLSFGELRALCQQFVKQSNAEKLSCTWYYLKSTTRFRWGRYGGLWFACVKRCGSHAFSNVSFFLFRFSDCHFLRPILLFITSSDISTNWYMHIDICLLAGVSESSLECHFFTRFYA